jgi:hypothetical protein
MNVGWNPRMTIICRKCWIPLFDRSKNFEFHLPRCGAGFYRESTGYPGGDSPVSYCFAASEGRFSEIGDAVIAC